MSNDLITTFNFGKKEHRICYRVYNYKDKKNIKYLMEANNNKKLIELIMKYRSIFGKFISFEQEIDRNELGYNDNGNCFIILKSSFLSYVIQNKEKLIKEFEELDIKILKDNDKKYHKLISKINKQFGHYHRIIYLDKTDIESLLKFKECFFEKKIYVKFDKLNKDIFGFNKDIFGYDNVYFNLTLIKRFGELSYEQIMNKINETKIEKDYYSEHITNLKLSIRVKTNKSKYITDGYVFRKKNGELTFNFDYHYSVKKLIIDYQIKNDLEIKELINETKLKSRESFDLFLTELSSLFQSINNNNNYDFDKYMSLKTKECISKYSGEDSLKKLQDDFKKKVQERLDEVLRNE